MLNILLKWMFYALIIVFVSWIIPGIRVENFLSAMFVCIIIGLINTFIKPFGLFSLVLNAFLLMFSGWIAPGFEVDGFFSALFGSILLSLFSFGVDKLKGAN